MTGTSKNYYSILEVSRHSSAMEIRQAYKRVSKRLHPDKNPSPNADVMFQQVKVAYDVSLVMIYDVFHSDFLRLIKIVDI